MALALFVTSATQRHALVEQNVVADLGSFPDHNPRAMVDEESAPNSCARVDLYTCEEAAELRNHPWHQGQIPLVKTMGQAVKQNRMKARVAKHDLEPALGRRVPV